MTEPPLAPQHVIDARFLAAAVTLNQLPPPTTLEIAFAGRSNVGKSSLMNLLMGRRKLVRTSSTPGCTRAIGFFEARLSDQRLIQLVDLPGYGYAARSREERSSWKGLVEGYLGERVALRAVVVLVDIRRGIEADDRGLLEFLSHANHPSRPPLMVLIGATKMDRLPRSQQGIRLGRLRETCALPVFGLSTQLQKSSVPLFAHLVRGLDEPEAGPSPPTPPRTQGT